MKSALETLSPTRVKLTIEVSAEEFQPSLEPVSYTHLDVYKRQVE